MRGARYHPIRVLWGGLDQDVEVTYCLVTDGDAGGFDQTISRPDMAAMRRIEQTRAAKEVGVESLIFLGHADGRVTYDLTLRIYWLH